MEEVPPIEFIIRRIPPSQPEASLDFVVSKNNGRFRATSGSLGVRSGKLGLSCSRLKVTSPKMLLAQLSNCNPAGWSVAIWKVSSIPAGLVVVVTPSDPPELDLGHCEIRGKPIYSRALQSKLAKSSTILTETEIDSLQPGDMPVLT